LLRRELLKLEHGQMSIPPMRKENGLQRSHWAGPLIESR
jgi:hypothetical protein